MKNIFILVIFLFNISIVSAADIDDNQIIDELNSQNTSQLKADFKLKTFSSCEDMNKVMIDYIKSYYKNNQNLYYRGGPVMMEATTTSTSADKSTNIEVPASVEVSSEEGLGGGISDNFSTTNTQVLGVDEAEIIKTDGKYIYYYNESSHIIDVVDTKDTKNPLLVKKIKIPLYFYDVSLYVDKSRLTIVASGYDDKQYRGFYINRNIKTYVIAYDISDINKLKLLKLYAVDGDLSKSRRIGDYLYIISNNYFDIPFYNFKNVDDIYIGKIIPQKIDLSYTTDNSQQNYKYKNKTLPYNIKSGNITSCNEIQYILPDSKTIQNYNFTPSYNIISVIDLSDTTKAVTTKVIAGNNSELYMSKDNLYMSSVLYTNYNFSCPVNARCMVPFYYAGVGNTLIHKLNISKDKLTYKDSAIIPGLPLNQYSMDEYDGKFRIITSLNGFVNGGKTQTNLYILDENLKNYSSLTGLGIGESFQASRYIKDKLFLVTFKQKDPLFVIDLADQKKPKLIGELKIPGYSTYLHPYDDNHLIGLGYDTTTNQWGGTQNIGIKLDLYEMNYNKVIDGMIDVKQLHTQTIGDTGTYTDAIYNPKMFIWNSAKNILLLPMTIQLNTTKTSYDPIDYFNGLVAFDINKTTGIKQKYKITHIDTAGVEEKRKLECKTYSEQQKESSECKILLDGSTYCPNNKVSYNNYIPNYCYKDSPLGAYLAQHNWDFSDNFIKRSLFIGENSFAISDSKISSHDLLSGKQKGFIELK